MADALDRAASGYAAKSSPKITERSELPPKVSPPVHELKISGEEPPLKATLSMKSSLELRVTCPFPSLFVAKLSKRKSKREAGQSRCNEGNNIYNVRKLSIRRGLFSIRVSPATFTGRNPSIKLRSCRPRNPQGRKGLLLTWKLTQFPRGYMFARPRFR